MPPGGEGSLHSECCLLPCVGARRLFGSLADICRAAGWATPNTFARFYSLRVEPVSSHVLCNSKTGQCHACCAIPPHLGIRTPFSSSSSVPPDGEPWWNPPSTPGSQTGRSSLTPGPVLVLARPGFQSAPVLDLVSVWPDSPSGNPICVFFHGKVSLTINPCLLFDRASVRFCWQPSSLLLGRICPRVQSYVVLPQAWASPYQCLHVLPPFGQNVASVAPFSGRLASLPLRQAATTNRKDLKPCFTGGRNPLRFAWGKEQQLGYLQQRCTQWSRWALRLANLR